MSFHIPYASAYLFHIPICKSGYGLLPDLRHLAGRRGMRTTPRLCPAFSPRRPKSLDFDRFQRFPAFAASGRSRPFRCASSQNRNRVAGLRFCVFCARWRNVGFSRCAAHTLAVGAESRTQRRHAAHGAVQAVCPPTGSIGTIISTVGRSAPSTLFRQMRRSPLLFRNDTKMPFFLRASTLFRI